MARSTPRGLAASLIAVVAFAALSIFATLAARAGVPLGTLLPIRFGLAAAVLLVTAARRGDLPRRRDAALAFLLGAGLFAGQAAAFLAAVRRIDAPLAAALLYTYPALVTVGAIALGRERLRTRTAVALGLVGTGTAIALAAGGVAGSDTVGLILALAAAAGYATYLLLADGILRRIHPFALAGLVCLGAALASLGAADLDGGLRFGFGLDGWMWLAAVGVISTALPQGAFLLGVHHLGATRASLVATLEPLVTAAIAIAVLGSTIGPWQACGAGLVVAGAVASQLRFGRRKPAGAVAAAR
jgi:drug/metabolite transporter (DMT)-like permease